MEDKVRPTWPRNAFVYLLILVASIALFYSFLAPTEADQQERVLDAT